MTNKEVVSLYLKDFSCLEIGNRLGITLGEVIDILRAEGYEPCSFGMDS